MHKLCRLGSNLLDSTRVEYLFQVGTVVIGQLRQTVVTWHKNKQWMAWRQLSLVCSFLSQSEKICFTSLKYFFLSLIFSRLQLRSISFHLYATILNAVKYVSQSRSVVHSNLCIDSGNSFLPCCYFFHSCCSGVTFLIHHCPACSISSGVK